MVATRDDRLKALEQTMLTREALLEVEREQQNDRIAHLERIFGGLSEQLAAIGCVAFSFSFSLALSRCSLAGANRLPLSPSLAPAPNVGTSGTVTAGTKASDAAVSVSRKRTKRSARSS